MVSRWGAGLVAALAGIVMPISASAQIAPEQYLKYLPLTYPSLVRASEASERFNLFGDPLDPAYRDEQPRDGIDDQRGGWLNQLAVRFAPPHGAEFADVSR